MRPFGLPTVLDVNVSLQDGFCEVMFRKLTINKGCKLLIGSGSIFRIF